MAFEVGRGEAAGAALERVARELARSALDHLARAGEDPVGAVHEARRNIRSLRALLRLLRGPLGEERYAQEAAILRDAARLLSPQRDAHVVMGLFDRLIEELPEPERIAAAPLRDRITRHMDRGRTVAEQAAEAATLVAAFEGSLSEWAGALAGAEDAASDGIRSCARRARRRWREAAEDPLPERLHELRKRCKDVREQLRILRPLKPGPLGKLERRYGRACDRLGEGRDLHLLGETLCAVAREAPESAGAVARVVQIAAARRAELIGPGLRKARSATRSSPRKLAGVVRERWDGAGVG